MTQFFIHRKENLMQFTATFWALVPPIVAIALALITKETYSSLFIGVVVGGLLYAGFNPVVTLDAVINEGLVPAIADNAGIFLFLVILGVMVALVNSTGASAAFGKWAGKHVKTKTGALLATFVLGVLIFIDDYFNKPLCYRILGEVDKEVAQWFPHVTCGLFFYKSKKITWYNKRLGKSHVVTRNPEIGYIPTWKIDAV